MHKVTERIMEDVTSLCFLPNPHQIFCSMCTSEDTGAPQVETYLNIQSKQQAIPFATLFSVGGEKKHSTVARKNVS